MQTFSLSNRTENDKTGVNNSQNLIATRNNKSNYNKGIIVICAHYDCERNSVGANDNASGVSVVRRQLDY
ncbi:M28 family peptidase [Clostridium autoethanogenum]|uniref:M28 family peptidase n=1 Tax=Clostridium autoethanogenum TaxID=84023 RepID=A0A3M0SAX3_9CLOT|nr:M28 family peptidase [Clostridium autoethanogenum]